MKKEKTIYINPELKYNYYRGIYSFSIAESATTTTTLHYHRIDLHKFKLKQEIRNGSRIQVTNEMINNLAIDKITQFLKEEFDYKLKDIQHAMMMSNVILPTDRTLTDEESRHPLLVQKKIDPDIKIDWTFYEHDNKITLQFNNPWDLYNFVEQYRITLFTTEGKKTLLDIPFDKRKLD